MQQPKLPVLNLKWLLAGPGLLMALLALVASKTFGLGLPVDLRIEVLLPSTLACYFSIKALGAGFERAFASFRFAGGLLEGIILSIRLSPGWALFLAWTSAIGEELFFRGLVLLGSARLMPVALALLVQAMVFALFHPVPRRAWAYQCWTFLVGLLCGLITLQTNSLAPSILAHFAFNLENFNGILLAQSHAAQSKR